MLEHAILVRHGRANVITDELLPSGKTQIISLTNKFILRLIPGERAYVFYGLSGRTIMSALEIDSIVNPRLYGYQGIINDLNARINPGDKVLDRLVDLYINHPHADKAEELKEHNVILNTIIMVSHHTVIPPLADTLAEKFEIAYGGIDYIHQGHAIYMNLKKKTHEFWSP